MKNRTNALLGIATIIGVSISSSALADSIHDVLEIEPVRYSANVSKSVSNPRTLQDYVNNARAANETGDSRAFAELSESTADGWQKALGTPAKL